MKFTPGMFQFDKDYQNVEASVKAQWYFDEWVTQQQLQ